MWLYLVQVTGAFFGEGQGAVMTFEQRDTQTLFQLLDLLADG
jgi:hypothetical protein